MVEVARRSVLIGGTVGVGLLVAGCTSGGPSGAAPTAPPPPDPLLAELADERRLIAAYDTTMARYPALRPRLTAVRDDHAAHAAALVTALGAAAPPSPTPDETPTAGTPTDGTPTGDTPTGDTPTGDTPTDGTPTDGTPTDGATTDGATTDGATGGGATGGAAGGSVAGVPGTVGAAVAVLRAAERSAASARGTVALTAPADRARLLAGISASEASHVAVLT